jgi:trypsin
MMDNKKLNKRRIGPKFGKFLLPSISLCISVFSHFPNANADSRITSRVIGGVEAAVGAWPFMVALIDSSATNSADGQFCGGTLIGPRHVLTAGHCVTNFFGGTVEPSQILVQIGGADLSFSPLSGTEQVIGVTRHPLYNPFTLENDLAILKLRNASTATPVNLPAASGTALYPENTLGTVVGWGASKKLTDSGIFLYPFKLNQGTVPVASDQTCSNELGRYFRGETMMCAGQKASSAGAADAIDACYGDSGGPLIVDDGFGNKVQVGVVSWGVECGSSLTRGVYSEVSANLPFATSFPVAQPIALTSPTVTFSGGSFPTIGDTVTCQLGTYDGDQPTSLEYGWFNQFGTIFGQQNPTYTITEADSSIGCVVRAINSGGTTETYSAEIGVLLPTPTPTPTPTSTPTPSAEPTPLPDSTPPTGSILDLSCKGRRCSFIASADDESGSVKRVTASVERSSTNSESAISGSMHVPTRLISSGIWYGSFAVNRRIRQRISITLKVVDEAGNRNGSADTASLILRAAR